MELSLTWNADFIDSQYRQWKKDPNSVSRDWRIFFEGFNLAAFPEREAAGVCEKTQVLRQMHVEELVYRYRDLGHLLACLDPLVSCPTSHPLLDLEAFNLQDEDLDRIFYTPRIGHMGEEPLRDIIRMLRETYCRTIGVEYMHLQDPEERGWLQERMESVRNRPALDRTTKLRIFNKICEASLFEQFLHTRYVGQKRFSAEGAEAVVSMLDTLIECGGAKGAREVILGMAHRGRLSVQVNNLQKPYRALFCEFEESYDPDSLVGSGDVKYHKGYFADIETDDGHQVRVLLATNPSHLEAVNPVVEGIARARQDALGDEERNLVLPLLIHGDAAFAGQGVVCETLNLSQLKGFRTGGTIHIIINNQIGFTTLPEDARSTRYSTDVAKMLMVPIFHVHGEDPEAAAHVISLACDYRFRFHKDVVIDIVCYRRFGHNEADEPYYTQPKMYDRIKDRPPLHRLYSQKLIGEGVLTQEDVDKTIEEISQCLQREYEEARKETCEAPSISFFEGWDGVSSDYSHKPIETGVAEDALIELARKLNQAPDGFAVHQRLQRILARRLETVEKGEGIDWATAEALSLASLLVEGTTVRFTGEDTRRGTFSQRHSVLVDIHTGEELTPLNQLSEKQGRFEVYDSMLSEYAVLGFEYGYSLVSPEKLVLWEAQFGDFVNNGQVIIDQFISSAESKWHRLSGLVLLLPHGYEGQGPEHSSARFERFLQLCAQDNMQVCYPSTPAQYFHLLHRQMKRNTRKPLVVLTPKSLLRHSMAVSKLAEMASGSFKEVIEDEAAGQAKRILLCSGKIYYDLVDRREGQQRSDIAIVRLEQFYPFPGERIEEIASKFSNAEEWFWVQEEPQNMGGWEFVRPRLESLLGKEIRYVGRPAAASPATGYHSIFKKEQAALVERAIGG